jgi:hypothetical protein
MKAQKKQKINQKKLKNVRQLIPLNEQSDSQFNSNQIS